MPVCASHPCSPPLVLYACASLLLPVLHPHAAFSLLAHPPLIFCSSSGGVHSSGGPSLAPIPAQGEVAAVPRQSGLGLKGLDPEQKVKGVRGQLWGVEQGVGRQAQAKAQSGGDRLQVFLHHLLAMCSPVMDSPWPCAPSPAKRAILAEQAVTQFWPQPQAWGQSQRWAAAFPGWYSNPRLGFFSPYIDWEGKNLCLDLNKSSMGQCIHETHTDSCIIICICIFGHV